MIERSDHARCRQIARQVVSEYARDKVTKALYEAALEGLAFGPCELPLATDREWLRTALAGPLQDATDAALRTLRQSVGRTLETAPPNLLVQLERRVGELAAG